MIGRLFSPGKIMPQKVQIVSVHEQLPQFFDAQEAQPDADAV